MGGSSHAFMYYYISGKITYKTPTFVVVDAGGIGYEIKVPLSAAAKIAEGQIHKFYTHFHVKEDAQQLYGFLDTTEKELFLLLLSVSGVGPSTALMVLSILSPAELQQAVLANDPKPIQAVKGVGAKTAQKVVIDLKDKVGRMALLEGSMPKEARQPVASAKRQEALDALVTLGFNRAAADKSIQQVLERQGADLSVEQIIRHVLRNNT